MALLALGLALLAAFAGPAHAAIITSETNTTANANNDRLAVVLSKANGRITSVSLDGISLLGTGTLYYDCNCVPTGFYTPGADNATIITGTDSTGTDYAGIITRHTNKATQQYFEKSWWIRDGANDIHHFTRTGYWNEAVPFFQGLGEMRTLFRPSGNIFTHLVSNERLQGPIPGTNATSKAVIVQDATTYLGNTPEDPYVQQVAEYFTKYTFSVPWRGHKAHGMYSDGRNSGGKTFGAWLVMNTRETYFGGPIHGDLVVDGIVYDYIISGHYGNATPNITHGMDRTYGPQIYHFNSDGTVDELREDAESLADPTLFAEFYDSIAPHVANYPTTAQRGSFKAKINLPRGASNAVAVLAQNGVHFEDNAADLKAYQYWGEVSSSGAVSIPRVKEGTYRLTVYADGIFGDYIQDNVKVTASKQTTVNVNWRPKTNGKELWRIGVPDKSAGEFRHGETPSDRGNNIPERSVYWGAYDFPTDFPEGVNYTVGQSSPQDLNYIHWSVFPWSYKRTEPVLDKVSNWTINFELDKQNFKGKTATFTVQLAGVKTSSGNTNKPNGDWSDLPLTFYWNDKNNVTGVIHHTRGGSCGVRSQVSCYQNAFTFTFPGTWLKSGWNTLVMALPYNATNLETSILPGTVYVQYDALRLELGP